MKKHLRATDDVLEVFELLLGMTIKGESIRIRALKKMILPF